MTTISKIVASLILLVSSLVVIPPCEATVFGSPSIQQSGTNGSNSISVMENTAKGDLIVVGVLYEDSVSISTVADSIAGNSYSGLTPITMPSGDWSITFYSILASSAANSSNVITVTFSGTATGGMIVWDFPITGTVSNDVNANGTAFLMTSVATSSYSTTGSDELVLSITGEVFSGGTWTQEAGYTQDSANIWGGFSEPRGMAQRINFSSPQTGITTTASISNSGSLSIYAIAFKGAAPIAATQVGAFIIGP